MNSARVRDRVRTSDRVRNKDKCIFGFSGPWLWWPLAMVDRSTANSGLAPLWISEESPCMQTT